MRLEEVPEFVRASDGETWNVIVREMGATRKRRDEEAARRVSVGEVVVFRSPDTGEPVKGKVTRIARRGRLTLELMSPEAGWPRFIGVPASMVTRCE